MRPSILQATWIPLFLQCLLCLDFAGAGETIRSHKYVASQASERCDCDCSFKKNKCGEFKNTLADQDKEKVIVCGQTPDPATLLNNPVAACLHGILDPTLFALLGLPASIDASIQAVGTIIQNSDKCNADPEAKLALLRNVVHGYEKDMIDIMTQRWTCGQIAQEVQNREALYDRSIHEKRMQIEEELENSGTQLDPDAIDAKLNSKLTQNETIFLRQKGPSNDLFLPLVKKYGDSWNCFSPYERARLLCDSITVAAMSVVPEVAALKASAEVTEVANVASAAAQSTKALDNLRSYLLSNTSHSIAKSRKGPVLKIGYLERSQQKFMVLTMRAIDEGSLKIVDAGSVIGPKVFTSINSLVKYAVSNGKNLTIQGSFNPKGIMSAFKSQSELWQSYIGSPRRWTAAEVEDFKQSLQDLHFQEWKGEYCLFKIEVNEGKVTINYSSN